MEYKIEWERRLPDNRIEIASKEFENKAQVIIFISRLKSAGTLSFTVIKYLDITEEFR